PNSPGTIAMARQTAPDTATGGWFFNTSAGGGFLPPASLGGYAVFGGVVRAADLAVVDAIAALPLPPRLTVVVTASSTSSNMVSVSSVPAGLAAGWNFLGRTI